MYFPDALEVTLEKYFRNIEKRIQTRKIVGSVRIALFPYGYNQMNVKDICDKNKSKPQKK